ncbi:MAG TPA: flagellar biosynthetic protein FliO [Fimbriimonas sp.]|nr:flagellar biosynthetic protein FliO [Fimbriimonas sp.]
MKAKLLLIATALATLANAQDGILGTKGSNSPMLNSGASTGGSFLQMMVAVIVVVGLLKFVAPKLMAKFGGRMFTPVGSQIKIEESASFPGGNLYLVNVKDRSLLVGVTGTSIQTLADLGITPAPDPGPTFMEMIEVAHTSPEPELEIINHAVIEDRTMAQDALARLQRLMK